MTFACVKLVDQLFINRVWFHLDNFVIKRMYSAYTEKRVW